LRCLLPQRLGRRGAFFDERGILLGGLIHLVDGFTDLGDTGVCCALAWLISSTMTRTCSIASTICAIVAPASPTNALP
jgi:hypothetical protein